jgi:hypothetical protein
VERGPNGKNNWHDQTKHYPVQDQMVDMNKFIMNNYVIFQNVKVYEESKNSIHLNHAKKNEDNEGRGKHRAHVTEIITSPCGPECVCS